MTSSPDAMLPTPGRYRIDPTRSTVTFRTRHLFGLGGVTGTFAVRSGEIAVGPSPSGSSVTAVIDAASFRTGHHRRDRDVVSTRFLHVDDNPDIVFEGTEPRRGDGGWVLPGHLTVRGQTRPVELTVLALTEAGGELRARATTRVDRFAFGIAAAKGMAARHLDLDITVVSAIQPTGPLTST